MKQITPEEQQKRNARFVQEMLQTEGWVILSNSLVEISKSLVTKLMESNDPQQDLSTKADIRAINSLIEKVQFYAGIDTK